MRQFFCWIIITICTMVYAQADEHSSLIGSLVSPKDIMSTTSDIVIGKFIAVRGGSTASMAGIRYHGKITILESLKGNASAELDDVGFSVIQGPVNTEAEPDLNHTYIIFLADRHKLSKLLPATGDNIAEVKALIAASSK